MLKEHSESVKECLSLAKHEPVKLTIQKPMIADEGFLALMRATRQFGTRNENVSISFYPPSNRTPLELLEEGHVDIAVTVFGGDSAPSTSNIPKDVTCKFLCRAPFALLAHKDNDLCSLDKVTLKDVAEADVVSLANRAFDPWRYACGHVLAAAGFPKAASPYAVNFFEDFFLRVRTSEVVFLTEAALQNLLTTFAPKDMVVLPIDDELAFLSFYLVAKRQPGGKGDVIDAFLGSLDDPEWLKTEQH